MTDEVKRLKVRGSSPVKELAGSIIKCYDDGNKNIELRAIGASSVNQMYKALATARSVFAQKGLDLTIKPGYDEADINGEKKTVMIAKIVVQ